MPRLFLDLVTLLVLLAILVVAHDTRDSKDDEPAIYKESDQYIYFGCYNETTEIKDSAEERALNGGTHLVKAGQMTVPMCLGFCTSNGTYRYAGLEWSRECWCSKYISSLSEKLDNKECTYPCEGNSSQICGGALKLSVYELSDGGDLKSSEDSATAPRGSGLLFLSGMLAVWLL